MIGAWSPFGQRFVTFVIEIADELSEIVGQRGPLFCRELSRPLCSGRDTPKLMFTGNMSLSKLSQPRGSVHPTVPSVPSQEQSGRRWCAFQILCTGWCFRRSFARRQQTARAQPLRHSPMPCLCNTLCPWTPNTRIDFFIRYALRQLRRARFIRPPRPLSEETSMHSAHRSPTMSNSTSAGSVPWMELSAGAKTRLPRRAETSASCSASSLRSPARLAVQDSGRSGGP